MTVVINGTTGITSPGGDVSVTVTSTNDASISGLTVGKGGGAQGGNTALGASALAANTTGNNNVATGIQALLSNTTGSGSAAVGVNSLYSNTTGASNTALGTSALFSNTTASSNTAVGYQAGYSTTSGGGNTFIGYQAGYSNAFPSANTVFNTCVGYQSGYSLAAAYGNTLLGPNSGRLITTGLNNTVIGAYNGNQGGLDIRTASNYIVLSDGDGNPRITVNNQGNTGIGNVAPTNNRFYVRDGRADSARMVVFNHNGATNGNQMLGLEFSGGNTDNTSSYFIVANNNGTDRMYMYGNGNILNSNNSYGGLSDIKLKENIVDATPKLDDLMKVKIRQYIFKSDETQTKQIGVVAQELEEVFAGMVDTSEDIDKDGKKLGTTTKSVKYSVFVPMLIKAIQELNAKLEAQALEIATLKAIK